MMTAEKAAALWFMVFVVFPAIGMLVAFARPGKGK